MYRIGVVLLLPPCAPHRSCRLRLGCLLPGHLRLPRLRCRRCPSGHGILPPDLRAVFYEFSERLPAPLSPAAIRPHGVNFHSLSLRARSWPCGTCHTPVGPPDSQTAFFFFFKKKQRAMVDAEVRRRRLEKCVSDENSCPGMHVLVSPRVCVHAAAPGHERCAERTLWARAPSVVARP